MQHYTTIRKKHRDQTCLGDISIPHGTVPTDSINLTEQPPFNIRMSSNAVDSMCQRHRIGFIALQTCAKDIASECVFFIILA